MEGGGGNDTRCPGAVASGGGTGDAPQGSTQAHNVVREGGKGRNRR